MRTHRDNADEVTGILKRIQQGEDPRILCREAGRIIQSVQPADIATAEENLIKAGCSARLAQQLSAAFMFMGMHQDKDRDTRSSELLPDSHIIRRIMVEHDFMNCMLADLNQVAADIHELDDLNDASSEFRKLTHILEHLNTMKEHIEREEHILCPQLRRRGWQGLCRSAQQDHIKIATEIDNLFRLVVSFNDIRIQQFKTWLLAVVQRLVPLMREHMRYEDEILLPIAVAVIDDPRTWDRIKSLCDEIGYCSFHH